MYNDYFDTMSYYEKPDFECGPFEETLSESKLNHVREFFEDLINQLCGKDELDVEGIEIDIEELCATLCVPMPKSSLTIERVAFNN